MIADVAKVVRDEFEKGMKARLPAFRRTRMSLPNGWRAYSHMPNAELYFIVVLRIGDKSQIVQVDVLWNRSPETIVPCVLVGKTRDDFLSAPCQVPLPLLRPGVLPWMSGPIPVCDLKPSEAATDVEWIFRKDLHERMKESGRLAVAQIMTDLTEWAVPFWAEVLKRN